MGVGNFRLVQLTINYQLFSVASHPPPFGGHCGIVAMLATTVGLSTQRSYAKRSFRGGLLVLSLLLLCSCEQKPEGILSKGKMEEVLYDYHIAQYMASTLPYDDRYKSQLYIEAVFDKHGISEAQFDTSLVYYNRHTDQIRDIYDHVKHRLEDYDAKLQLESGSNEIRASFTLGGDTADIWSGHDVVFMPHLMPCRRLMTSSAFCPRTNWEIPCVLPEHPPTKLTC